MQKQKLCEKNVVVMAGSSDKKIPMFPLYYALSNALDFRGSC